MLSSSSHLRVQGRSGRPVRRDPVGANTRAGRPRHDDQRFGSIDSRKRPRSFGIAVACSQTIKRDDRAPLPCLCTHAARREIVAAVVAGLDTRAVTERLFISRHTVQDHLKSIFQKIGIHSRRQLLARFNASPDGR